MAFKPHYGTCTGTNNHPGCNREKQPIKTKRLLCQYCEQARKKKPKKKLKKEKKMLKLFIEIWDERLPGEEFEKPYNIEDYTLDQYIELVSHHRVCFVTLTPITHFLVDNFSHVCTKNYVNLKDDKRNIVLKQPHIHRIWEQGDRGKLEQYPAYKYLLELKERLIRSDYESMKPLYRK